MASGYVTKEWKDRITEFPTRRQLAVVSETGSGMTVDVTRAEGLVSQEGDAYSAANMNGMEQRVKAAFDNVDTDVAGANSAVSGLTTRMGNAESNISGLTTRMGTAESNISGLGTRMGSAESNITKISGDLTKVKVYVGSDGKLHFVNSGGADSVLPFSPFNGCVITVSYTLSVTTRSGDPITSTSGAFTITVSKNGAVSSNISEFHTGNSSGESYSKGHFYITGLSVQFL